MLRPSLALSTCSLGTQHQPVCLVPNLGCDVLAALWVSSSDPDLLSLFSGSLQFLSPFQCQSPQFLSSLSSSAPLPLDPPPHYLCPAASSAAGQLVPTRATTLPSQQILSLCYKLRLQSWKQEEEIFYWAKHYNRRWGVVEEGSSKGASPRILVSEPEQPACIAR